MYLTKKQVNKSTLGINFQYQMCSEVNDNTCNSTGFINC